MKKNIIWRITLLIGVCPFIAPFLLGIYRMSIEAWTWSDWLFLYSFAYWPTYIVGLALVILSVKKLINRKNLNL